MDDEEEWIEYDGGVVQDRHKWARRIRVASDVAVIPEWAFAGSQQLMEVDLNNVTTISEEAFAECIHLWEIDLSNVTKIGRRAFEECRGLKRVSIPSSVATIEGSSFHSCTRLVEVDLGEGLKRIGTEAFRGCYNLRRINVPASVTDIEDDAFHGCDGLKEVQLNEGLQHIGERAFQDCTSLVGINIPSTASKVGGKSFCGCSGLSEVVLREGIHDIGAGAFDDCTSLEHSTIPLVAFVIDIRGRSCQLMRTSMPVPPEGTLAVSEWLQYRSLDQQLEQAEAIANEILARHQQTDDEIIQCICNECAYYNLVDATTILELAIWRVNLNGDGRDADVRQRSRRNCGRDMNVIIPGVVEYLED